MSLQENDPLPWRLKPIPELVRLAWPIAISMLSYSIMTLVDTLFVGRLGASALAAVGIGGVASFTLICFGFGLLRATKVVVSQARGAGRVSDAPPYVGAALLIALLLGALGIAGGRVVAQALPSLLPDGAAATLGAEYLWIRNLGAPLALLAIALREARYGLGDSTGPMRATLLANAVNVALDAVFIFGLDLGVAGAAWATVCAHGAEAAAMLWIARREIAPLRQVGFAHVAEITRLGVPLGLQFILEVGSFTVLVAILAKAGEVDLAAHQIALQLTHFSFLPALALGEAASVLTGQAVGANEDGLVRSIARRTLGLSAIYTGVCGLGFALFPGFLAAVFTTDLAVQAVTVKLLWIAAAFQIADGANAVARCVLRGTGDVRFPALIAVVSAWVCLPPLAWLLGLRLGLGAVGGWLGLLTEIFVGSAILWWRLERGAWAPAARASRARLEAKAPRALAPVAS